MLTVLNMNQDPLPSIKTTGPALAPLEAVKKSGRTGLAPRLIGVFSTSFASFADLKVCASRIFRSEREPVGGVRNSSRRRLKDEFTAVPQPQIQKGEVMSLRLKIAVVFLSCAILRSPGFAQGNPSQNPSTEEPDAGENA
jgi:hypothetical protein